MECSGGGGGKSDKQYPRFASGDNEIINFTFPATKNTGLSGDITGTITDSTINLTAPYNVDLSGLIAEYTTNSTDVEVNGVAQESGITANDFAASVEYTVTADNGDSRKYTVTVIKAPSSENSITAFSINGSDGVIDQDSGAIAVSLSPHTAVTSLKALFSTAGKYVKVGETLQESGVTANDFSSPVTYTVYAEDGSSKTYTVTVTVQLAATKEITYFGFKQAANPSLSTDVTGTISGNEINIVLPYGSGLTGLKATFETTGNSVTVNNIEQVTDITANDFSSDIVYHVTAENGENSDYTIKAEVAKNDAMEITQYKLDGENCTIDESSHTISVTFPSTKTITGLIASFISTGVGITAGGIDQVSGVTVNDFSSPVTYTVKAENVLTTDYTVNVTKSTDIAGLWNFEYDSDGSYTIVGATVVDGELGNALSFTSGNYVIVPDSDDLTLASEGSIDVILNPTVHMPYAGVVHKGVEKDFSDESYSLQFWGKNGTDGTVRFSIFNDAGSYAYVDSQTKLSVDTWYHIVATWDASTINLYINGNLEKSITNSIGNVRDSAGALIIGAQLPVTYSTSWSNLVFNGIIDRVQISNNALTASEVAAIYQDLPFASGVLTGYILRVTAQNCQMIIGILFSLITVLIIIFIYNRKKIRDIS